MCENAEKIDRLDKLLAYVLQLGRLRQTPTFKIEQYKQLNIWEHELKGRIGIQHNIDDDGVSIWLKIERLQRIAPPPIPEQIQEWVTVINDPTSEPQIKDELIKTLPAQEAIELVSNGKVLAADVLEPPIEQIGTIEKKDVIFRRKNNQKIAACIDDYLLEQYWPWQEKEKPRRETIKIYDSLYSLQQTIEAQGDEQPIELIWGIGISRWRYDGHQINHPLLEQPIEIEVNTKDGSILIHPRNIDPIISLEAYYALGNPGVDALSLFCKGHFSQIPEDIEFSPYINASFEPVLRQAATCLSNNGIYWPDNNPDTKNRQPNNISESLEITDSWVIFAKPRSSTALIKDVECLQTKLEELRANGGRIPNLAEKFVTELSNETPLQDNGRGLPNGNLPNAGLNTPTELFFPKAFNDQQVKIIDTLERNDGVVVQGPPGTGKTHTIANIVCHYLATGRRVLVTSKGEPALSVLQEQIPEELRGLTISLLTNERQGMEQIENAVQSLERLASDTDLVQLRREVKHNEQVVQQIKQKLNQIDQQIKEWGRKQFAPIEGRLTNAAPNITPMELAKQVMNDQDGHDWFADKLGSSEQYTPQFNNADIAKIRTARRRVGEDIVYVGRHIPNVQDLPDGANILAIHNDLSKSANIAQDLQNGNIPPLAVSVNNAIERAKLIGVQLKDCSALLEKFESDHENYHWLKQLYRSWIGNIKKPDNNAELFDELLTTLSTLVKQRAQFVTTRVQLPDPSACFENVTIALTNLAGGNRAFGLLPFVKKETKIIIKQARVDGEIPTNQQQWRQVLDYTTFQDNAKKFAEKWNHAGQEIGLPKFVYRYGGKFGNIYNTCEWINKAKGIASRHSALRQEVKLLFPVGIDATSLGADRSEIDKTIHAIEQNLSCINLQSQREKLTDLTNKLENSDGEIAEELRNFITNTIGNTACEQNEVSEKWQKLIAELNRINRILVDLAVIKGIADKIQASGARIWSEKLKTEPLLTIEDALTPTDWHQTWKWKQCEQYLHEIDGREQIKRLSKDRSSLDNRLKQTFSELVRLKTNIGLHNSMTDHVKGALTRFVTAVGRIGRGTGIRAPRYRRDAYRAMQECYDGVPCWIMPTWRVSESLPSAFGAFDLVIIDEASQSDITVLPTILRAKVTAQVVFKRISVLR